MKIALLNPPHRFKVSRTSRWPEHTKSGTLYYPFWLAHAAGVLIETGHEAVLIDAIARGWDFARTIAELEKFDPELLVLETSTPTVKSDVRFVEEFKKSSSAKVVMVGTHASALPEESLYLSEAIDFVARNEYDYTIPQLADVLENGGELKDMLGISYRKDKKIVHNPDRPLISDLDSLPFVSKVYKKFLDVRDYRYALARHPMIQIKSSRGCPSACTFCNVPQTFMAHRFRMRSAENFVNELEWIKENMPEIKEIFIEDDTFSVNKKRVVEICELIRERKLDIVWSANARADIPYEVLKEMKAAGCRMLIVGYESGNQGVLNNVKKGITLRQAEKFTEDAKKVGVRIFGCFMIGLPGDTRETIEETLQFAKRLRPDMIQIEQAVPFPGTEFYSWCKENNYLITEDFDKWLDKNGQLDCVVSYPLLSSEEIKKMRDRLTLRFYLSPRQILYTVAHNLHPSEFKRLAKASFDYLSYLVTSSLHK